MATPPSIRLASRCAVILLAATLAACGTRQGSGPGGYPVGGGNYRQDGPHANPPANLNQIPDATPRIEPLMSGPNRPYVISGRRYVPDTSWQAYQARGRASWYGRQFHGRPTSSGEPYDMYAMTAAHPTLPIPCYVRVTHVTNGRSVIVRVNDRGPFVDSRVIDLSYVAAHRLGTLGTGTGEVVVELITPQQIRAGEFGSSHLAAAPAAPAPTWTAPVAEAPPPPSVLRVANAMPPPAAVPSIPVPVAPPQSPPAAAGSFASQGVYLQLGAFGEADNAQALARRLSQGQGGSRLAQVQQSADQLFRVRLGPYPDRQQAMSDVEAVYRQTGIMPHVVAP